MPDQKISQLASGTNAQAGDLFVIARSGANYSLTTAQLLSPTQSSNSATGLFLSNADLGSSATSRITFATQGGNAYIEARRNASGALVFNVGAADRWVINSSGNFLASTDNSIDIGASGANRPRDLWIGRNAAISGDAYVGIAYAGASGLSISPAGNLSFAETVGISYVNIFRQSNSAATVVANGYKYTNTANGFASSLNALWARSAIRLSAGGIQLYADPASTVANGTDMTPTLRASMDSAGNLGLGVTPSANWFSGAAALQFGARGGLASSSTYTGLTHNLVATSGGYAVQYMLSAAAAAYLQGAGTHEWYSAPSGTAGNVATLVQRMFLSAAGNLGIGATPSAFATVNVVQVSHGSLFATTSAAHVGSNVFFDGSYKYIGSDFASRYQQFQGVHSWHTAASGTAGNAITFTQAMTLDASGNLLVGKSSASYSSANRGLFEINGTNEAWVVLQRNATASTSGILRQNTTGLELLNRENTALTLGTNDAERVRVSATGDVRLTSAAAPFIYAGTSGVVEAGFQLDVLNQRIDAYTAGTMRWRINGSGHFVAGADGTYDIGLSGSSRPRNLYLASGANVACPDNLVIYDSTSAITRFGFSTNNTYNTRTAGSHIFQAAGTERVRIKAEGQVRYVPLAAAPTTNVEDGDVYYDSGTNKLRVRAGGAWVDLH